MQLYNPCTNFLDKIATIGRLIDLFLYKTVLQCWKNVADDESVVPDFLVGCILMSVPLIL